MPSSIPPHPAPPASSAPRPPNGITMDVGHPDERRKVYELNADYANAIFRAGGMPVLLPHTTDEALLQAMIDGLDGLLLTGGPDLDPTLYNEPKHEKTKLLDKERQAFDFAILARAEKKGIPILGVCLGCQIINVHRGGSLHQHVPDVPRDNGLLHARAGEFTNAHDVTIRTGTKLATILPADQPLRTNSRHHQAIHRVGNGLVPTAHATDGILEAVEDPSKPFFLAVQWHPENLYGTPHAGLFEALVKAAKGKD